jgi:hypothetical protein
MTVKRLVRSFCAVVFSGALGVIASTQLSAASGQTAAVGALSGTVSSSSGQAIPNAVVQLRNLTSGQMTGTTASSGLGYFSFNGLIPGNYAVEVLNASGQIVGTSAAVSVPAGIAVTGVGVTASAAVAAAGGGVGARAVPAPAKAGRGASKAAIIAATAAAAGVAGAAYATSAASPSQ